MKLKTKLFIAPFVCTALVTFVLLVIPASCNNGSEGIFLNDLSNPFIGKWQSQIPSMDNALMLSEYKADGTFTCEFPDVPPEYGGGVTYTGAYLISGNALVTFLSSDSGIGAYTFSVFSNNIINVTEIESVNEDGTIVSGNTTPFIRQENSPVNKENIPFTLSNDLIGGTWSETSTAYKAKYQFKEDATALWSYEALGQRTPDMLIAYTAFFDTGIETNVLVLFIPATNAYSAYAFSKNGDNAIKVKEIKAITFGSQGLQVDYGTEVDFTKQD